MNQADDIIAGLLERKFRYIRLDISEPDHVYLWPWEIQELEDNYLPHCCPRNPGEKMTVLGMEIREI